MKKFMIFLLSLTILSFPCAAEDVSAEQNLSLSLTDAIELALKDNPQLSALETARKANEINLDAANRTRIAAKNAIVSTSAYEVMYVMKGYYCETYKMLLRLNALEQNKVKTAIAYNVTEGYYNYKLSQSLVELTEKSLKLAEENLAAVSERYNLGMIAKLDLENASLSVESVKNTLESYRRNSEIALENLKIALQLDGKNINLILTDGIEVSDFEANPDEDIKNALSQRYDVNALKENYELAKLHFEYTKPLTANSANYQTSYSDLISKEYSYTNNQKLIALSIKNTYYSVLNAADSLKTAEKKAELSEKTYEIQKLKFDNGMITNTELTKAMNDSLTENINLENAKLKYKMAVEKYNAEITTGL